MTDKESYAKLIERFRTWLFELPDSELLLPMLELRFTPDEARFLSSLPFMPHSMDQLVARLEVSEDQLLSTMQPLMKKGFIMEVEGKSAVRYSLTDQLFAFYRMPGWKGEDNEMTRALAPKINKYYTEHFGRDFMGHPTKGLRAIPILGTVEDTRTILPYEDLLYYVEQEDYHTVSECACRDRHNLDPAFAGQCEYETTNCLHFGKLGRYIVGQGMGKEITREETLDILQQSADAGMVHGISNYQRGMDTICNCCSCCCLFLEKIRIEPPNPRGHQRSNYMILHDPETCKACGLCAKRCPIDAIELVDKPDSPKALPGKKLKPKDLKQVSYDAELCIGCGVCVHKCPTQSLSLVRRSGAVEDIPESPSDAGKRLLAERGRDLSKIF